MLERHEHFREPTSVLTTAQWDLRDNETAVTILNYSRRGFCISSETEGKPGDLTLVKIELKDQSTVVVPGEIQWHVQSADGFIIGCEFLDANTFQQLSSVSSKNTEERSLLDSPWFGLKDGNDETARRQARRHRMICTFSGSATVLLCLLIVTSLLSRPTHQHFVSTIVLPAEVSVLGVGAEAATLGTLNVTPNVAAHNGDVRGETDAASDASNSSHASTDTEESPPAAVPPYLLRNTLREKLRHRPPITQRVRNLQSPRTHRPPQYTRKTIMLWSTFAVGSTKPADILSSRHS